jgi:DNA-binding NtrC family response regulator
MPLLWIVHREQPLRSALERLAGAPAEVVTGSPGDAVFDEAPPPDAVLLGLTGDLEQELEFVHRVARRLRGSAWILIGDEPRLQAARRLFDTLPAATLPYPPPPALLRDAIQAAARRRGDEPLPLSERRIRETLSERVARAFTDLELPELLRALDPRLLEVPVLILGEPGTGRSTLARYIHHFGATARGALLELPCTEDTVGEDLLAEIARQRRGPLDRTVCSLWLSEVQRLPARVQHHVQGWVELGLPAGTLRAAAVRWLASGGDAGLEPRLQLALGGLTLRIPPLRERPAQVANLASGAAQAWCAARGLRPRRLAEDALSVLEDYPWPGNLRELEAVVEQSLASSSADPLGREDLVLDGEPFAPLDAGSVGVYLEEETSPLPEPGPSRPAEPAPIPEPAPTPAEPEAPEEERPRPAEPEPPTPSALLRLAAAFGHQVRNPLTALRTLVQLLPERWDDPEFRDRFAQLAAADLARVEQSLARLDGLGGLGTPERRQVDVGGLLQEVLERRRDTIHERRILVLEELDRTRPEALCDPAQLRFAFEALVDGALALVPERGDLYVASRRHESGLHGAPGVRVLLRFRDGAGSGELSPAANALEFAVAELLVRSQGGSLTLDTGERSETVLVLDLPA